MVIKNFLLVATFVSSILFINAFQVIDQLQIERNNSNNVSLAFNYDFTSPLIHPPYIGAVINDPTDPSATEGIVLDIKENNQLVQSDNYSLIATSDNASVVDEKKINIIKQVNGHAIVKIIPSGIGYSNITLTLTKGKSNCSLIIYYASSEPSNNPANTIWHTGVSDASAVVALDSNYMLVADDEVNSLFVYHRYQSGLPVASFSYSKLVDLPVEGKEADIEAGTRSLKLPEKTYWLTSMTNGGKRFELEPNRNCLFQTNITGTGANTKFIYKGVYKNLRQQLIKWGDSKGYKFSNAARSGETAKKADGFNVEGIAFAPDSTTLFIGFRAPIVPVANRKNALIAPIKNFESWFNEGHPVNDPVIENPIELNLDGRGIRDFVKLKNGKYIIIAGNSNDVVNAAVYLWSGTANEQPVLVSSNAVSDLKMESGLEIDSSNNFSGKIQAISDNGSNIFYNDNVSAKLLNPYFKKFRSDIVKFQLSTK